jgi:glycerol dehydrogenase-like iron-containing ADH family enzyme
MTEPFALSVAPSLVLKGDNIISKDRLTRLGSSPLIVGGKHSLSLIEGQFTDFPHSLYSPDCSEASLARLSQTVRENRSDLIVGVGGGKALDMAKLLAYKSGLPVVTIPTSAATCAGWTALSNIYSDQGAFQYDVPLPSCPNLLLLDYQLIQTAPRRTLVAGIGDALAKWYESSISSGTSTDSLSITAVQTARILRDLLWQKSSYALENPGSSQWREVVDATVLLAGVIGGIGGANCRTVAAHAVHNGLTHLVAAHDILHGEKVAYGILVQLRLEEIIQSSWQQLLGFNYSSSIKRLDCLLV